MKRFKVQLALCIGAMLGTVAGMNGMQVTAINRSLKAAQAKIAAGEFDAATDILQQLPKEVQDLPNIQKMKSEINQKQSRSASSQSTQTTGAQAEPSTAPEDGQEEEGLPGTVTAMPSGSARYAKDVTEPTNKPGSQRSPTGTKPVQPAGQTLTGVPTPSSPTTQEKRQGSPTQGLPVIPSSASAPSSTTPQVAPPTNTPIIAPPSTPPQLPPLPPLTPPSTSTLPQISAPTTPPSIPAPSNRPAMPYVATPGKKAQDLSPEELAKLPDDAKNASDEAVIKTLIKIAQAPISQNFHTKEFIGSFNDLPRERSFKHTLALKALIKQLTAFADDMKKKQSSGELYDDLDPYKQSTIIKEFKTLLANILFAKERLDNPLVQEALTNIIVYSALAQRPIVQSTQKGDKILSDWQVSQVITNFMNLVRQDTNFEQFAQAEKKVDAKKGISNTVTLSENYIPSFGKELRRLLTHPEFLKIASEKGELGGSKTMLQPEKGLIAQLLFNLDPAAFNANQIKGKLIDQLYLGAFDDAAGKTLYEQALQDIIPLKAALNTHSKALKDTKPDMIEFLTNGIQAAKNKKALEIAFSNSYTQSKIVETAKPFINAVVQELKLDEPNIKIIAEKLPQIGLTNLALKSKIEKIIKDDVASSTAVSKIKQVLLEAKNQRKPVDGFLKGNLSQLLNDNQKARFMGPTRTLDSAYGVLKSLLGTNELAKIVTLSDFYSWLHEYGILISIFAKLEEEEAKEIKSKEIKSKEIKSVDLLIKQLIDSLKALNTGSFVGNLSYFSPVKESSNAKIIQAGKYRDKLNALIKAVEDFDAATMKIELLKIMQQAGTGVEQETETQDLIKKGLTFMSNQFKNELIRQLNALNKGSQGYSLAGGRLNQHITIDTRIYQAIGGIFTDVISNIENYNREALNKAIKETLDNAVKKLSANQELKKASFTEKDIDYVRTRLETYLNDVATKMEKIAAQLKPSGTSEQKTKQEIFAEAAAAVANPPRSTASTETPAPPMAPPYIAPPPLAPPSSTPGTLAPPMAPPYIAPPKALQSK
jgi:hypothetical protein